MSTVVTNYKSQVHTQETLDSTDAPAAASGGRTIVHDGYDTSRLGLTAGSSVPVSLVAMFRQTLVADVATIDLTSLHGVTGTLTALGKKVQIAKFKAPISNSAAISVTEGAVNGYALAGPAWKATLAPGQEVTYFLNDKAPDVAAADKTIDLAGVGSTDYLECTIIAG